MGELDVSICFQELECGMRKILTLQWRNLAGVLHLVIKGNIPSNVLWICDILGWEQHFTYEVFSFVCLFVCFQDTFNPTPLMRKTSEKFRFMDILQHTWPVFLKIVKGTKYKERRSNCHRLAENGKKWPWNAVSHRIGFWNRKRKDWWNPNKIWSSTKQ